MASTGLNENVRYEPEERCSPFVAFTVGLQGVMVALAPTIMIVAITALAAGQDEEYLTWSVFATLIIVGAVTALQASRIGRLGAGHVIITVVTPNFIAISVLALAAGGPAMLASLIVLSSLFFLAMAAWLPLLRRIITPTVSGTVLMLIATMVLPIALDRFDEVPEDASGIAGPSVAAVTLCAVTLLALRGPRRWRPLSLLVGVAAGCVAASLFGVYDLDPLLTAPWFGIPGSEFPGLDLTPTVEFWALLPMFLIVTLVQAIKGIGDSVVIQKVSWRKPRATDFRRVQGAIYSNGVGIMLSGLAGTPPTTSYSSLTTSLVNLTGVAARRVGYAIGIIFLGLALFPKVAGALLTIPSPVMGAFLLVALAMLFVEGIQTVSRAGLNSQKALVVGLAFSVGVGLQYQNIFEEFISDPWDKLLGNGLIVGTAVAIALTGFLELTGPRSRRIEIPLHISNLARIDAFLGEVAAKMGWDAASTERLRSAGEETLSSLLQSDNDYEIGRAPRLVIVARPEDVSVEIEFMAVFEEDNLEDRLAYLNEQSETVDDREVSFRLLRHYASSVHHQKFHGLDIVTVRVDRL